MNATTLKILMIGLPILVALAGIGLIVWLIVTNVRESKNAKKSVNGLLFIHPDNGAGYRLIDKSKTLEKPTLRPIWYKPHWWSGEMPFWFFYEDKTTSSASVEPETFKCICGYDAPKGKQQLHAHMMWNPHRKATKEEWAKLHSRLVNTATTVPALTTAYVIKPYDIDADNLKNDVIITPYGVYDINNWDCQKRFLTVRLSGLQKALQLGAGVIMAIACLIGIIALGGELGKKNTAPANASPTVQIITGEQNGK